MRILEKTLIALAVLVLGFIAIAGKLLYDARGGLQPLVDGARLTGGAITVKDDYTAAFLIPVSEGAYALVDCGVDANGTAIKAALAHQGAGPEAVKAIFLTNAHPDHIAACHQFQKAEIYAFPGVAPVVAGQATTRGPLPRFIAIPVESRFKLSRTLEDGKAIQIGAQEVKPYLVPGHTDADAAYLINGTLYLGDSLAFRTDGTLRPAVWLLSDSTDGARASLRRLAAHLQAEKAVIQKIAPAHSAAADSPRALFDFAAAK